MPIDPEYINREFLPASVPAHLHDETIDHTHDDFLTYRRISNQRAAALYFESLSLTALVDQPQTVTINVRRYLAGGSRYFTQRSSLAVEIDSYNAGAASMYRTPDTVSHMKWREETAVDEPEAFVKFVTAWERQKQRPPVEYNLDKQTIEMLACVSDTPMFLPLNALDAEKFTTANSKVTAFQKAGEYFWGMLALSLETSEHLGGASMSLSRYDSSTRILPTSRLGWMIGALTNRMEKSIVSYDERDKWIKVASLSDRKPIQHSIIERP